VSKTESGTYQHKSTVPDKEGKTSVITEAIPIVLKKEVLTVFMMRSDD
jgi:hypothetical protein